MRKLEVNQIISAPNLPRALEGQSGTYFVQFRGQSYVAIAQDNHSLTDLIPVGIPVATSISPATGAQENWVIQKLAETTNLVEQRQQQTR